MEKGALGGVKDLATAQEVATFAKFSQVRAEDEAKVLGQRAAAAEATASQLGQLVLRLTPTTPKVEPHSPAQLASASPLPLASQKPVGNYGPIPRAPQGPAVPSTPRGAFAMPAATRAGMPTVNTTPHITQRSLVNTALKQ